MTYLPGRFARFFLIILFVFLHSKANSSTFDSEDAETPSLFKDLALVESINKKIHDDLPFFYSYSFVGGYFTMPSARMASTGMFAFGGGYVSPYSIYGMNFQMFDHIELSANYRVYNGITEGNFGKEGFGDDAERIGNIKIALLLPQDGFDDFPSIAVGADDFIGTKRFNSQYVVVTKKWLRYNFEASLGFGKGRIKGLFGGIAWTPLRQIPLKYLNTLTLIAEYDANNYKKHPHEHPHGRSVKSRVNIGASYLAWDLLQIYVSSIRGEKVAASASLRYNLGETKGFFPKLDDPIPYLSPVDMEPLGILRPEKDFVQELTYAFGDQGLDLFKAYITFDERRNKELWIKVVNNRYREEEVVRERIQNILSALTPSDIATVTVVVEADAIPSHAYQFRTEDLHRYHLGLIGEMELQTVAPMRQVPKAPGIYDSTLLFKRNKEIWTFTVRPRLLNYFGSSKGKYKYSLGIVAFPEGYLWDEIYYKFQVGYSIKSSMSELGATDRLNPSQLPNVRSDTIRYFQSNTLSLEQAYLQKAWNLGKGFFYRLAAGYFEIAYGGLASEVLYYPVNSDWAIGIEAAGVLKRRYKGIAFTRKIRKLDGFTPHLVPFVGVQYFLDLYYHFSPLNLEFKISAGQFLAKDKGVKIEAARIFSSGLVMSLWYTVTNGHDKVNGHTYYDKGFAFLLPLDVFLKQSSLNYVGYAMSAWLRDVGAKAETGKTLFPTLYEERY